MQAQAVVDKTQVILSDSSATRWSEATLLGYVADAHYKALEIRPDFLLQAGHALTAESAITALTDTLQTPDRYADALADWAAFRALSEDNSDDGNLRQAMIYEKRFYERMLGSGGGAR